MAGDKPTTDSPPAEAEQQEQQPPAGGSPGSGEIDFSTFVLSLSTSAMVHLGEAPDPDGRTHRDLDLARDTIDILDMLRDKTRGNLDDEETKLLDDLLYNLRLRFVQAQ